MPLSWKLACVLAAASAALAAGAASAQAPAPREVPAAPAGDFELAVAHDGRARTALVHVPPQAAEGRPLPVLLNFHDGGANASRHRGLVGMDALADRAGFIAVYPNGTGWFAEEFLTWNAGLCCGYAAAENVDDVGFVRLLLDALEARAAVDSARVYATGLGNGAMLAYRLGAQASDRIAAIAPVAGSMVLPERRVDDVRPALAVPGQRALAIMHIHSLDDTRAPYYGGPGEQLPLTSTRTRHPNAEAVLQRWIAFDGCGAKPALAETRAGPAGAAAPAATKYVFSGCRGGAEIVLWKLAAAGHAWPGGRADGRPGGADRGTGAIDANEEIWGFLRRFVLPPIRR